LKSSSPLRNGGSKKGYAFAGGLIKGRCVEEDRATQHRDSYQRVAEIAGPASSKIATATGSVQVTSELLDSFPQTIGVLLDEPQGVSRPISVEAVGDKDAGAEYYKKPC
jgi:hypothetical protein